MRLWWTELSRLALLAGMLFGIAAGWPWLVALCVAGLVLLYSMRGPRIR